MKKISLLIFLIICSQLAFAQTEYPDGNERAVKLKGTRNTRQLGGLPVDKGMVKEGKIFRSGALCFASREDAAKLHGMNIQTILELRLPVEINRDGADKSYLRKGIKHLIHWPMGNSHGIGREAYIAYVAENEKLFRDFFRLLSKEKTYPILFHCSAGKDRTGILTALLLESLGTPREVIMDDYIHSRRITPKLKVREDWLQVVFDAVDRAGGIDSYLQKIGVSQKEREAIKSHLVESKQSR